MKIAFLSIYYGGADRGAETFVLELSERLKKNNEVDIISGSSKPLAIWPVLWRFFLDPQGIGVLLFTLKNVGRIWRKKYDIVIPIDGGWEALLIRKLTWLYGGRVVISGQSGKVWFDRISILSFPNAFVALSNWALEKLRWMNPIVKYRYIPNGVDLKKFGREGKALPLKLKHPIVLVVGAFTKQKRLDLAIRAVSRLKNASLLIAGGGGDLREELTSLGKRLLGPRFDIISVPFEKMPEVYRACDIFTLPSNPSESFGNVLVEAMASGLPVIASDDPVRREIVGDAGLFTDPANESDYAEALDKALKANWGTKPSRQAEKFSWDEIANQYEELMVSIQ